MTVKGTIREVGDDYIVVDMIRGDELKRVKIDFKYLSRSERGTIVVSEDAKLEYLTIDKRTLN